MKLPFIKRSNYEKLRKEYDQLKSKTEQEIRNKNYQITNLQQDLKTANKAIDEILPKLVKIIVEPNENNFNTYRIVVYFDRKMIYDTFIHGNSKDMIEYLSERIGHQVQHEMNTINFARLR